MEQVFSLSVKVKRMEDPVCSVTAKSVPMQKPWMVMG